VTLPLAPRAAAHATDRSRLTALPALPTVLALDPTPLEEDFYLSLIQNSIRLFQTDL
jgi:hypothetical protein